MEDIVRRIKEARFVWVCGNGGSASTAEHFTNDLFSKGIRAVCLNSNSSIMTMIANDFGYEYVFSKQIEVYSNREDLVILFSVSGKSKNIIEALNGTNVIPIFGKIGESYGDAEDRHLQLVHKISNAL